MAGFGGSEEERSDLSGSLQQVGPAPTVGERAAHLLLFQAAVALVAAKREGRFPSEGRGWEEAIATARRAGPDLVGVQPGGRWPADLLERVAVLVDEDGSAMVLMTEMLRPGAFPGTAEPDEDPVPELATLTVYSDGRSHLDATDTTVRLLALAPTRWPRGE